MTSPLYYALKMFSAQWLCKCLNQAVTTNVLISFYFSLTLPVLILIKTSGNYFTLWFITYAYIIPYVVIISLTLFLYCYFLQLPNKHADSKHNLKKIVHQRYNTVITFRILSGHMWLNVVRKYKKS